MVLRISCVAFTLGLALANIPSGGAGTRVAVQHQERKDVAFDPHGMVADLEAELVPEAIVTTAGRGELLESSLIVSNHRDKPLKVLAAVEVLRDDGTVIVPAALQQTRQLASNGTHASLVATPSGLKDGHYQIRSRVAVIWADGKEGGTRAHTYFKVEGGTVIPMDLESWYLEAKVVGVDKESNAEEGNPQ